MQSVEDMQACSQLWHWYHETPWAGKPKGKAGPMQTLPATVPALSASVCLVVWLLTVGYISMLSTWTC